MAGRSAGNASPGDPEPLAEEETLVNDTGRKPVESQQGGFPQDSPTQIGKAPEEANPSEALRTIGVDRASTPAQAGDEMAQRERNKAAFYAFAAQPGFEPVAFHCYTESGGLSNGKRQAKVRELVQKNLIDAVWYPDEKRASRSTKDGLAWFDELFEQGIRVFVGSREIKRDASSHVATGVSLTLAESERITLQDRAMRQHDYVARGQWLPSTPPYGYDRDPETRHLTPNEAQASVVHRAFAAAAGQSLAASKVLAAYEETGLRRALLRKILANPIYRGAIKWGQQLHPFEAYRLVTDDEWYGAQPPKRMPTKRTERAIEALAREIGNASLVSEVLEGIDVPCRKCPPSIECESCRALTSKPSGSNGRPPAKEPHRLRLMGTSRIGAHEIPRVGCRHGHEQQLVASYALEAALLRLKCKVCGNTDASAFWIRRPNRSQRFDLQCKQCRHSDRGWHYHPLEQGPTSPKGLVAPALEGFDEAREAGQ